MKNSVKIKNVIIAIASFISIQVIALIILVVFIFMLFGVYAIDAEQIEDTSYMDALKVRQSQVLSDTQMNANLNIYFSIDQMNRADVYEVDSHIHVGDSDIACFVGDDDNQISDSNFSSAYTCMGYGKHEEDEFEYYYNIFNNSYSNIPITNGEFGYPVEEPYVITAGFNSNDSVHQGVHEGVDFVPLGSQNIYSVSDAKVIETVDDCDPFGGYLGNSCGGYFGNHIVMLTTDENGNEYKITYGHMSVVNVNVGDEISKGESIGVVGNSGNTTGKHLHLQIEIMIDGTYVPVDPILIIEGGEDEEKN